MKGLLFENLVGSKYEESGGYLSFQADATNKFVVLGFGLTAS